MFNESNSTFAKITMYTISCWRTTHNIPLLEPYLTTMYVAAILILVQVLPTVVLNATVSWIICTSKAMQTSSNILITFTAATDILAALIGVPCYVGTWLLGSMQRKNCVLYMSAVLTAHFSVFLSYLLVCLMALDRYLAIFKPYFYARHFSNNKVIYIRVVSGLACMVLVICSLSFLTEDRLLIELTALASSPLIFISIYIQVKVHVQVQDVRKKISAQKCRSPFLRSPFHTNKVKAANTEGVTEQNLATNEPTMLEPSVVSIGTNEDMLNIDVITTKKFTKKQKERTMKKIKNQVNLSYLTLFVMVSLCVAYTPFIIVVVLKKFFNQYHQHLVQTLYMWSYTILSTKSLVNPVIYCYSSKTLRDRMKYILKLKSCRQNNCIPA